MAMRTFALLLVLVVSVAAADKAEKKKTRIALTEVFHGTVEVLQDMYGTAHETVEGFVHKTGVPAQVKAALPADPLQHGIGLTCSKIGCKTEEVNAHISKAQAAVQQVKAQCYEYAAKTTDFLHQLSDKAVTKFEQYVPSHKGTIGKNFWELVLRGDATKNGKKTSGKAAAKTPAAKKGAAAQKK